jgi:hypothetical protein
MRADGRTDGQTGITNLIVAFRNFANAPKNGQFYCLSTVEDASAWIDLTVTQLLTHNNVTWLSIEQDLSSGVERLPDVRYFIEIMKQNYP